MLAFFPVASTAIADDGPVVAVGVSGVEGTANVGSVEARTDQVISVTGVEATGGVGSVSITVGTGASVEVTGVEATGEIGDVTVTAGTGVVVDLIGLQAIGEIGDVSVRGDAPNIQVTGVEATSGVGTVTQRTTAVIPITFTPQGTTAVGDVEATGSAVVNVTGVAGSGKVGSVLVWGRIIPDPETVWTEIIAA